MSLEYAILGFLNYRPLSGYDLKKVFDNSVRHFWPADQSQIYRTLARLAEQGYVEQEIVSRPRSSQTARNTASRRSARRRCAPGCFMSFPRRISVLLS